MRRLARGLVVLLALLAAACGTEAIDQPIVALISLDGWKHDYLDRFEAPVLEELAARGVRAEGLIPVFPSKTFPNHYTIVTGLRPARHGIISNNMLDPEIPGRFGLGRREVLDPSWWSGEPIWQTVERQGGVSGTLFWPGSDVEIGGQRHRYWRLYDGDLPNDARVDQVIEWLSRPEPERPWLVTMYFSDVDSAGHGHGPESDEVREAARRLDEQLGRFVDGVERLGLSGRMHYILVSDHGMAALSPERAIYLEDFLDPDTVDVIDWTPVLGVAPKDGTVDEVYHALHGRHPSLAVYRRHELPEWTGLAGHPRLAPVIGIADEGWHITGRRSRPVPGGNHGYDARLRSMQGLFIAAGPRFRAGLAVAPFENVHLYELMCAVLGVTPAPNDGDPEMTRGMLRDGSSW